MACGRCARLLAALLLLNSSLGAKVKVTTLPDRPPEINYGAPYETGSLQQAPKQTNAGLDNGFMFINPDEAAGSENDLAKPQRAGALMLASRSVPLDKISGRVVLRELDENGMIDPTDELKAGPQNTIAAENCDEKQNLDEIELGGLMDPEKMDPEKNFEEIDRSGFRAFDKRNFDEIDRAGFERLRKRNFDEIDRAGFRDLGKRNFDEIDRAGFERLGKRNFDEIDRAGFRGFNKRDLDEVDRAGFKGFNRKNFYETDRDYPNMKRNFDEIDRVGFRRLKKRSFGYTNFNEFQPIDKDFDDSNGNDFSNLEKLIGPDTPKVGCKNSMKTNEEERYSLKLFRNSDQNFGETNIRDTRGRGRGSANRLFDAAP